MGWAGRCLNEHRILLRYKVVLLKVVVNQLKYRLRKYRFNRSKPMGKLDSHSYQLKMKKIVKDHDVFVDVMHWR